MTAAENSAVRQTSLVTWHFAVAVMFGAALVFMVEPMIARMILPKLGGSPAVWNTCVAFFQTALLAGYLYAHLLQRLSSMAAQVIVHLSLLAAAALTLPIGVTGVFGAPAIDAPVSWLLCVLLVSIGAPFAVLSASAPLLQAWHVRASHAPESASNPYVLYAASNLGSTLALLAYPIIVEPRLSLHDQSLTWSFAYLVFCTLIATIGLAVWRNSEAVSTSTFISLDQPAPSWRMRLTWLALAAVPSSLMLGATTYISNDVASVPFLWIIPLGLYLLTFTISFQTQPAVSRERALLWQVVFVAMAAALFSSNSGSLPVDFFVYTGAFFFSALVCHLSLAESRPHVGHLTEFYLFLSLGGVLGGFFNAFFAPVIFSSVAEFPLVLALSVLARPWKRLPRTRASDAFMVLGGAAIVALALVPGTKQMLYVPAFLAIIAGACAAAVSARRNAFAALIGALCLVVVLVPPDRSTTLMSSRSFFGVYRVADAIDPGLGRMRLLFHGTTIHGAQPQDAADRCRPTTYYAKTTPLGQALTATLAQNTPARIGVVGLGAGTLASYARPGDRFSYFEIDPEVARIAKDRRYFTYLSDCARGKIDIVLGDARLTLQKRAPGSFDMLALDAFSADTVPTHLLTVEALRLYLGLIKPNGILVLHLSNRNLSLEEPVAAAARQLGVTALMQDYSPGTHAGGYAVSASQVMLIAKSPAAASPFVKDERWRPAHDGGVRAWTDDYTDVFSALIRHIQASRPYAG